MKKNILRIVATCFILSLFLWIPIGAHANQPYVDFPDATVGEPYEVGLEFDVLGSAQVPDSITNGAGLTISATGKYVVVSGIPTAPADEASALIRDTATDILFVLRFKINPAPTATTVLPTQISSEPHVHSFKWETSKEPTETEDGEMIYVCQDKDCREVALTEKTTGQSIFMINTANRILNAEQNAVLHISTTHWKSFNKTVLYAMLKRPDVTYVLDFLSEGHKGDQMTVTIPAGFDVESFFDKDGWAGFLFINDVINKHNMAHNN